jgi:hypothetical protein
MLVYVVLLDSPNRSALLIGTMPYMSELCLNALKLDKHFHNYRLRNAHREVEIE